MSAVMQKGAKVGIGPLIGVAALAVACVLVGADALVADGLKSAGLTGTPPPNAGAFEKFVDQMAENAVWIIGTAAFLALVVVGGLFFFGHTRAQDIAMKIAAGVAIVILAPGIAA